MDEREESLDKRLDELESQLAERRRGAKSAEDKKTTGRGEGYNKALKLSSEFIAGIVTGALLGYLFDYLLGTKPWGMVIFLFIGFAASVLNMLRATGYVETPQPGPRKKNDKEDGSPS